MARVQDPRYLIQIYVDKIKNPEVSGMLFLDILWFKIKIKNKTEKKKFMQGEKPGNENLFMKNQFISKAFLPVIYKNMFEITG